MTAGRGIVHSERSDNELEKAAAKTLRHTNLGGAARAARRNGAGLRALPGRRVACYRRRRENGAHHRWFAVRKTVAGEDFLVAVLCRCFLATRNLDRRSAMNTRNARFISSKEASRSAAKLSSRDGCWFFRPAMRFRSRRISPARLLLVRWRAARRPAPCMVELCLELARAHRAGEGRLEAPDASRGARRYRVHSASRRILAPVPILD